MTDADGDVFSTLGEWGVTEDDYRRIDEQAIEEITLGASILATGGGGDPEIGLQWAKSVLESGADIVMVDPEAVPDDARVAAPATLGAPTVLTEKPPNDRNLQLAFDRLEGYLGESIDATIPVECGGVNSPIAYAAAGELGLPLVDVDGMNRAFPELQMTTWATHGVNASPVASVDDHGHTCIVDMGDRNRSGETIVRTVAMEYGGISWIACYPMNGAQLKETSVLRSQSLAWDLGAAVVEARAAHDDPVERVLTVMREDRDIPGFRLFTGKVVDIDRDFGSETESGFSTGRVELEGIGDDDGRTAVLDFQNEWLIARIDGAVQCLPPDLLALLDPDTGDPLRTDTIRYGYRGALIAMPAHDRMRTPKGIETFGPEYFGYDESYVPIEELQGGPADD